MMLSRSRRSPTTNSSPTVAVAAAPPPPLDEGPANGNGAGANSAAEASTPSTASKGKSRSNTAAATAAGPLPMSLPQATSSTSSNPPLDASSSTIDDQTPRDVPATAVTQIATQRQQPAEETIAKARKRKLLPQLQHTQPPLAMAAPESASNLSAALDTRLKRPVASLARAAAKANAAMLNIIPHDFDLLPPRTSAVVAASLAPAAAGHTPTSSRKPTSAPNNSTSSSQSKAKPKPKKRPAPSSPGLDSPSSSAPVACSSAPPPRKKARKTLSHAVQALSIQPDEVNDNADPMQVDSPQARTSSSSLSLSSSPSIVDVDTPPPPATDTDVLLASASASASALASAPPPPRPLRSALKKRPSTPAPASPPPPPPPPAGKRASTRKTKASPFKVRTRLIQFSTVDPEVHETWNEDEYDREVDETEWWIQLEKNNVSHEDAVRAYWELDLYKLFEMGPSLPRLRSSPTPTPTSSSSNLPPEHDPSTSMRFDLLSTPTLRATLTSTYTHDQALALYLPQIQGFLDSYLHEYDPAHQAATPVLADMYDQLVDMVAPFPQVLDVVSPIEPNDPPAVAFDVAQVWEMWSAIVPELCALASVEEVYDKVMPEVPRDELVEHANRLYAYHFVRPSRAGDDEERSRFVRLIVMAVGGVRPQPVKKGKGKGKGGKGKATGVKGKKKAETGAKGKGKKKAV